jgi:hypothetical protein
MECIKNEMSVFDGQNYDFWNRRMKIYLQEQGFDVWKVVVDRYKETTNPLIDKYGKKLSKNDSKEYKCYNLRINKVVERINVKIDETNVLKTIEESRNSKEKEAKE